VFSTAAPASYSRAVIRTRAAVARGVVVVVVLIAALLAASAASARIPPLYKNCTNLNKRYPHGIGKVGARDHTSGTPVTNFKRSTRIYRLAMSHNRGLDRDKDGIACEKA
jgi:Excalibur calcium-binding domain